jgi:hypothetical protein
MTNFGSIDVPKLDLSALWTFAKDEMLMNSIILFTMIIINFVRGL